MTNELRPKIWEFKIVEDDNPDLILDYYHADKQVNFATIVGALEQVIGVEFVTVSAEGSKLRVVARNTSKVYNELKRLFERMYGVTPFSQSEIVDVQL